VVLVKGETTQKFCTPSLLNAGESGTASWRLKALRQQDGVQRTFSFVVRATNADDAMCDHQLFIQGSPKVSVLTLPSNVLLRYGEKGVVPVTIDRTIGKDVSSYTFDLAYDPDVVAFQYISQGGTLTAYGWVGARLQHIAPGVLRVSDYTTSSPLHTTEGVLVSLHVQGVYSGKVGSAGFGMSLLAFNQPTVHINNGEIQNSTVDGSILVTNECLEPLYAAESYMLEQNRPNPFNPTTTISFVLPEATFAKLSVFDPMGREVKVLVNDTREKGRYSVVFDANELPSGLYFYRLETARFTDLKKMIIAR